MWEVSVVESLRKDCRGTALADSDFRIVARILREGVDVVGRNVEFAALHVLCPRKQFVRKGVGEPGRCKPEE